MQTTFVEAKRNTNMQLGDKHPYKVITRWTHPTTKEEQLFESRNLWFNPTERINRDIIFVYRDRKNPEKYYMDLSFLDN